LLGVGFVQSSVKTVKTSAPSAPKSALVDTARVSSVLESAPESVPKNIGVNVGADADIPKNVTQRDLQGFGADGADDSRILLDFCNSFSKLSNPNKQKLIELLTGVPCSDRSKLSELETRWLATIQTIQVITGTVASLRFTPASIARLIGKNAKV
jgi:hypothetical protein